MKIEIVIANNAIYVGIPFVMWLAPDLGPFDSAYLPTVIDTNNSIVASLIF